MALGVFSLDDLGTVLACRVPRGRGVPGKLDDTLRAAGHLADVGNAIQRELAKRYGSPRAGKLTAHGILEAAQRRPRGAGDCAHAAELIRVLEDNLPGAELRRSLASAAAGVRGRK